MAMTAAERMRARRAKDKANGIISKSDSWFKDNPDKHKKRVRRWRKENFEYSQKINRECQKRRRSTPWGKINNRMWPLIHAGLKTRKGVTSKYCISLGYTWDELAKHLERQFIDGMDWMNKGTVWQIDHIIPLSSFRFHSIECDEFKKCWGLDNLRPLLKTENQFKGSKS